MAWDSHGLSWSLVDIQRVIIGRWDEVFIIAFPNRLSPVVHRHHPTSVCHLVHPIPSCSHSFSPSFEWLIRQTAEVENNMNSVERIVHYATAVEQEAPYEAPVNKPAVSWPAEGRVEFNDVVMKYRPELPPVLKGMWTTYLALSSEMYIFLPKVSRCPWLAGKR